MYAIIRTGGKQYTVRPGDVVQVEKLENDLGSEFDINDVLLVGGDKVHVGQPTVKNAKVTVVVTKQAKARKVIVFKKKRRHSYRKFKTHRQLFTEIFVKAITSPDGKTEKTETTPNVVNVAEAREQRIQDKMSARQARVEGKETSQETKSAKAKAPQAKKTAKKAAGKSGGKKTAAKKAKKTVKKTSKKA